MLSATNRKEHSRDTKEFINDSIWKLWGWLVHSLYDWIKYLIMIIWIYYFVLINFELKYSKYHRSEYTGCDCNLVARFKRNVQFHLYEFNISVWCEHAIAAHFTWANKLIILSVIFIYAGCCYVPEIKSMIKMKLRLKKRKRSKKNKNKKKSNEWYWKKKQKKSK